VPSEPSNSDVGCGEAGEPTGSRDERPHPARPAPEPRRRHHRNGPPTPPRRPPCSTRPQFERSGVHREVTD
jgi:hypothetical protein